MPSLPNPDGCRQLLDRRSVLRLGAAACSLVPAPVLARIPWQTERSLAFYNLHTGEATLATYWADGRYLPSELAQINYLLRDFRSGEVKPIDVRLLDMLHTLRRKMDSREALHVISGYRSPKTNAKLAEAGRGVAKRSMHMRGMAIDIRLPGRPLADLRQAAKSLRLGGVGYYPKSNFIHVDVGRVRSW